MKTNAKMAENNNFGKLLHNNLSIEKHPSGYYGQESATKIILRRIHWFINDSFVVMEIYIGK